MFKAVMYNTYALNHGYIRLFFLSMFNYVFSVLYNIRSFQVSFVDT